MHELINENNIINIMRWVSKLRLDTPLARATLKVLELQGENLIREKEIFDILMELNIWNASFLDLIIAGPSRIMNLTSFVIV